MTASSSDASQLGYARVAGLMYLFVLATTVFAAFYVRATLIEWGDAAQTASNIAASERLFRIGVASDLVSFVSIVLLAVALFVLTKPVSRNLALLALFWWLGEAFILGAITLNDYIALILLGDAPYLAAFETSQLQALARVFLEARLTGYNIGLIFFGLGSVTFSYLLFKARYIPRILALLGIFSSVAITLGTFAILILPEHEKAIYPFIGPPIALYEALVGLWLLLFGASVRPRDS